MSSSPFHLYFFFFFLYVCVAIDIHFHCISMSARVIFGACFFSLCIMYVLFLCVVTVYVGGQTGMT